MKFESPFFFIDDDDAPFSFPLIKHKGKLLAQRV